MATEMPVAQAVFNYGPTKSIVRETFTIASDQTGKGVGRQLRTVNQYDDIDLRTVIRYAECVIKSFVDKRTAALFAGYVVRNLPNQIQRRAKAKLVAIDAAKQIDDLRIPPGNCLESLHGDRRGQHSIRINDQWRICFVWSEGAAWEVEIVDYHKG